MTGARLDAWSLTVPVSFRIATTRILYSHHLFLRLQHADTVAWGASVLYARQPHSLPRIVEGIVKPLLAAVADVPPAELRVRAADRLAAASDVRNAVDALLWELEAHRRRVPVAGLLGQPDGAVAITQQIFVTDPAAAADAARAGAAQGVRALKVKLAGVPAADERLVAAVRDAAGPDVAVRVDANRGYDLSGAERMAGRLAAFGVHQWEEPADAPFADLARLRAQTGTQVILDESVRTGDALERALDARACDVVNVKLPRVGGLTAGARWRARCGEAGVAVALGCAEDLGPGMWAILHAASAWRPEETEGIGWQRLGLDLQGPTPALRDGRVFVGREPGWGGRFLPALRHGVGTPVRVRLVHATSWGRAFRAASRLRQQRQRLATVRTRAQRIGHERRRA